MATQTTKGKAFEYACLMAFYQYLYNQKDVFIDDNEPYRTAMEKYGLLSDDERHNFNLAAWTAVKMMVNYEPYLQYGNGILKLSLNTDSAGQTGDVRDLLFIRDTEDWEIGISCKHDHAALKHSRITQSLNFGRIWISHDCRPDFIKALTAILDPLDGKYRWRDIQNKLDRYYVPILNCFIQEIKWLCDTYPDSCERMFRYFLGSNDFYKVISLEKNEQTNITGFNLNGTMNKVAHGHKPITRIPILKMPTKLYDIGFMKNSKTTIILVFDGGWTVSMRIHNKDEMAKQTSLAWDINLKGMPPDLYSQTRSWYE